VKQTHGKHRTQFSVHPYSYSYFFLFRDSPVEFPDPESRLFVGKMTENLFLYLFIPEGILKALDNGSQQCRFLSFYVQWLLSLLAGDCLASDSCSECPHSLGSRTTTDCTSLKGPALAPHTTSARAAQKTPPHTVPPLLHEHPFPRERVHRSDPQ
jgi:hypothetical protein